SRPLPHHPRSYCLRPPSSLAARCQAPQTSSTPLAAGVASSTVCYATWGPTANHLDPPLFVFRLLRSLPPSPASPPLSPPPPQLALPRKTDPRSRTSIASTSPFLPYHVDVMDTSDGAGDSRPSNYSTGLYSSPSASFDSLRDQILANARVLYGREHKLIEVITSKELDGSELVLQQNFAYLVAFGVGSSSSIPGVGGLSSSSNAMSSSCGVTILSCSEPAETRDEAMRSLLDEVEAEVGELVTKELKDQKIPIERKRRRRERLVEQSRLARSA
ncbi:hypothetical protein IWX50DRAFT_254062, partial [Phyllosticta citricarpa]